MYQEKDLTSKIVDYENGEMDQEEIVDLFKDLVSSGLVWELQGSYGRTAMQLINSGYIMGSRC